MTNITFCTSPLIRPHGQMDLDVFHGFTERSGGTSEGPFDSLNLGLHVGDNRATVCQNRTRMMQACGGEIHNMVCAEQVHGNRVAVVTQRDLGRGATDYATALPQTDALVTNETGLYLSLFFADCLPVFFVEKCLIHTPSGSYKAPRSVGIAHAGWRGLAGGVLENTIRTMSEAFVTKPVSLTAYIGPGIGPCCFEVGPEVASHFPQDTRIVKGKPHVNLRQAARRRLEQAGIRPQNIDVSPFCTSCLPAKFYSHRRDNGTTGRMCGVIGIRF